ncbi:MAG: hypothetical protein JWR35_949 [Marmoricola sp.]|nr:hypothetical protein [Marmoricola sp.]
MRIDLHTHSVQSDGTDTPTELVARAAAQGLDVIALTDHDHSEGWPDAAAAARQHGLGFVPGMEISTVHGGRSVHLLGYLFDPTYEPLAAQLRRTIEGRADRLVDWVRRSTQLGIPIDRDLILSKASGSAAISKNHLADALIEAGFVPDRDTAFNTLFAPGQPFHSRRHAIELTDAIELVTKAGGVCVIAHPWARSSRNALDSTTFEELQGLGLTGLEVDHQGHDPATRTALREIAARLDLVVTGSSDYHGTNKTDHELGCNTTSRVDFERLLARADAASTASGRRTPKLVAPPQG